jgi:exopolyphosphatase / guanosine-5'-triphosphate,3'-diphosphate pyrophosphatase
VVPRIAVIDLGTNSTRLLIGDVDDGRVTELERRTNVTRLGEGVDRSGRLAPGAIERVLDAVADYHRLIESNEVDEIVALATSAVRDAENADEFADAMRSRFGIEPRTISGDEEATLTFLGATSELGEGEPTLVLDIGGGSTEFVVGTPGSTPDFHVSTRAGSVRQTERHLSDDPPSDHQIAAAREEIRQIIEEGVPAETRAGIQRGIAVAGTATSLAAIDQELDPYDPARVHGYELKLGACRRMLEMLAGMPLPERRQVTGLNPDRAPTIVAGTVILIEAMLACGLESMTTSESDILHGAALSASRAANSAN